MATISQNSIPTNEASALTDDKPIFLCQSIVLHPSMLVSDFAGVEWHDNVNDGSAGTTSGVDITDSEHPTYRIYDYDANTVSRMTATNGTNDVYLFFDLGTLTASIDVDMIGFLNHNMGDLTGNITVTTQLGTDRDFTSTTFTVDTWSPSDNIRGIRLLSNRYSIGTGSFGCRVRVQTDTASGSNPFGSASSVPEFGEVIIGERIQLSRKADKPLMTHNEGSSVLELGTDSGRTFTFVKREGGEDLTADWNPSDTTPYSGLDDRTQLTRMWRECKRGSRAFIYVPSPTNDLSRGLYVKVPPEYKKARSLHGVTMEATSLQFIEQTPIYDVEAFG